MGDARVLQFSFIRSVCVCVRVLEREREREREGEGERGRGGVGSKLIRDGSYKTRFARSAGARLPWLLGQAQ